MISLSDCGLNFRMYDYLYVGMHYVCLPMYNVCTIPDHTLLFTLIDSLRLLLCLQSTGVLIN